MHGGRRRVEPVAVGRRTRGSALHRKIGPPVAAARPRSRTARAVRACVRAAANMRGQHRPPRWRPCPTRDLRCGYHCHCGCRWGYRGPSPPAPWPQAVPAATALCGQLFCHYPAGYCDNWEKKKELTVEHLTVRVSATNFTSSTRRSGAAELLALRREPAPLAGSRRKRCVARGALKTTGGARITAVPRRPPPRGRPARRGLVFRPRQVRAAARHCNEPQSTQAHQRKGEKVRAWRCPRRRCAPSPCLGPGHAHTN